MRHGPRDSEDDPKFSFKLPRTSFPEPIIRGVRGWRTGEGWLVLRLHYSADPERTTAEWLADQVRGYRGGFEGRDWRREMEIDFSAYKGEPVHAGFDASDSVRETRYRPDLPLWRGWDFGYRHPAVVFAQLHPATATAPNGTLAYLHEIYPTLDRESTPGIKTADLAQVVLDTTHELFPETKEPRDGRGIVQDFADPAGNQTKETSDFSSIEILQQYGIFPEWARVGRKNRIEYLRRYTETPGAFRINPHCALGIKALSAAYRYPEERAGTADRDMPDLGKKVQEEPYIHIMDALEYVAACNLEIPWNPSSGTSAPRQIPVTGDLATLLNASRMAGRTDRTDVATAIENELEDAISDLIGVDGDLTEVWARH
jgi:hypothetical protein